MIFVGLDLFMLAAFSSCISEASRLRIFSISLRNSKTYMEVILQQFIVAHLVRNFHLLWNLKAHHCVHKGLSLDSSESRIQSKYSQHIYLMSFQYYH